MNEEKPDEQVSFASTEVAPPLTENLGSVKAEKSLIGGFFNDIFSVCFSSTRFFREYPVHERSLGGALAFGICVEWLATALSFLIGLSFSHLVDQYLVQIQQLLNEGMGGLSGKSSQLLEMFRLNQMLYGIGVVILNPFFTLAGIYFTSILLFLGMKTFLPAAGVKVSSERFGFDGCVKLISYARGTSVFKFLPIVGGLVAPIWRACVIIIGVKQSFGVSTTRASFISYFYASLLSFAGLFMMIFLIISLVRMFSN